ncbi:hypothetical protein NQZ68_000042 [Dissostichus eleginoides]|nr:hypothetical protein NQZ68_000042 [Dissostichus eleginoides]
MYSCSRGASWLSLQAARSPPLPPSSPFNHPPCVRSFAAAWSRAQLPGYDQRQTSLTVQLNTNRKLL